MKANVMSIDVFKLPVFPAADVFPMMPDDELRELAEDIKANGVREPIVIANGKLVDGRNRRAACKIAGVVPPVRELGEGEDPTAYVISANIHRRHMMTAQRAMAEAIIYPEPEKGGRGKVNKLSRNRESLGVSSKTVENLLSQARMVVKFAPELGPLVVAGAENLTTAYKTAIERKEEQESKSSRLEKLRTRHPMLADKVVEDELTLNGAVAEARERDAQERERRQAAFKIIKDGAFLVGSFSVDKQTETIGEMLRDPEGRVDLLKLFKDDPEEITRQRIALETGAPRLIQLLTELETQLEEAVE